MANKARDIGARKLAVCCKIPIGRSLMLVTKDPSVFLRLLLLVVLISDIMVHSASGEIKMLSSRINEKVSSVSVLSSA
jgi:hypothetical protein